MSLEQKIEENTAAIRDLIAVLSARNTPALEVPGVSGGKPSAAIAETTELPATTVAPTSVASPSAPVTFDALKKAFLQLSTKEGGRARCEGVLKPQGLAKLSEAKPEQYGALLTAINAASAA